MCNYDFSSHFKDYTPQNKLKYLFYYLIGNLYANSDSFVRNNLFHLSHEFITDEEIFKLTGIYSISFDYTDKTGNYDKFLIENDIECNNLISIFGGVLTDDLLHFDSDSSFHVSNITNLKIVGNSDIFLHFGILFRSILSVNDIKFELLEK